MEFRTELKRSDKQLTISYNDKILLVGSCFSDSVGNILKTNQFQTSVNPFGTVFNPLIICKLLINAIDQVTYTPDGLGQQNGLFFHYDFHSKFSSEKSAKTIKMMNKASQKSGKFLRKSNFLILTLGSAIGYYLNSNGQIVGNCHKVPAKEFTKRLIQLQDMIKAFDDLIKKIYQVNSEIKILFTVSPVRHTREGLVNNSLSKARLLELAHHLTNIYDSVYYFPSYEIMMDDLRDYRFYQKDLIHPNGMAVDYIFKIFKDWYFSDSTTERLKKVEKILQSAAHKSQQASSANHQAFLKDLIDRIKTLEKEFGRSLFKKEKKTINRQLV